MSDKPSSLMQEATSRLPDKTLKPLTRIRKIVLTCLGIMTLLAAGWLIKIAMTPATVIGFTGYDLSLDFFQQMEIGVSEEAEALGYNYIRYDQAGDETKLVTSFKRLVEEQVAAIIVSPISPEVLPPLVDSAHQKGIPVIINDIGGGDSDYDAIVISDNWQGGKLAAEYTAHFLKGQEGSREVAIITVEPSAVYAARRGDAYRKTIEAEGFKVVAEISAYSKQEDGYSAMKLILKEHPSLVAIFAENDPMAVGAANAVAEAGRKDIMIVGFNGDKIARDAIAAGLMQASVAQDPAEMGRITAILADRLIKGEAIIFDDIEKREIYVPVEMVTLQNINS
ncbi:MAG: substrate-binding domain-containing protein [Eubacteriales bacterium]|nr:substrate-binding domain-containing protein [Eubacteriales bacterium]